MSKFSKLLIAAGAIIGIVVVSIVLSQRAEPLPEVSARESVSEPSQPTPVETARPSVFTKGPRRQSSSAPAAAESPAVSATATDPGTGWEEKVDEILASSGADADKVQQMVQVMPTLAAEGQEEVAQHLSNLVPDEDYAIMQGLATTGSLPEPVLDVLLDDALNRPNSLKLPALLQIARTENHPKAGEARDFLELFLEEDYGVDWDKWQVKVQEWLKDNPD